jgi:hypothetical protein
MLSFNFEVPIHWVSWALSSGVKRPERETEASAEDKKRGSIQPIPNTPSWPTILPLQIISTFTDGYSSHAIGSYFPQTLNSCSFFLRLHVFVLRLIRLSPISSSSDLFEYYTYLLMELRPS